MNRVDETKILLTEGVLILIFGLVFVIVQVSILFHMTRLHTRIGQALEKVIESKKRRQWREISYISTFGCLRSTDHL